MDKCGICKKAEPFKEPLSEQNGMMGRFVDPEYLVHVKTSHGIEPDMLIGIMNSIVADYNPSVETNVYDTNAKKLIPAERRDWMKNI